MNIKLWESFNKLENISESRLFYSPKLKEILKEINTKESLHLLNLEGENFTGDITLIDVNSEGQFTYNTERNFQKKWPHLWDLYFNQDQPPRENNKIFDINPEVFKDTNRGVITFGKLIMSIYSEIGSVELQHLINSIKSLVKEIQYNIKVVDGDEIEKYYNIENCKNDGNLVGGTLGSSCMMRKSLNIKGLFDLYTKNPATCKLVVMLDNNEKLVARALLWKVTYWEEGNLKEGYLQDRVYYIKDWMGTSLINWAEKNGYFYK